MEIQQLAQKLQEEGIAKGKAEAEKIVADARKNAEELLANARKEAEKIVAQGKTEAQSLLENGKNSLQLAARDVKLELQKQLAAVLQRILDHKLAGALTEANVIRPLLENLLKNYIDQAGRQAVVEIAPQTSEDVKEWLVEQMKVELRKNDRLLGFCVQEKDGGKVEVTLESVREALLPYLRGVARELVKQEK